VLSFCEAVEQSVGSAVALTPLSPISTCSLLERRAARRASRARRTGDWVEVRSSRSPVVREPMNRVGEGERGYIGAVGRRDNVTGAVSSHSLRNVGELARLAGRAAPPRGELTAGTRPLSLTCSPDTTPAVVVARLNAGRVVPDCAAA